MQQTVLIIKRNHYNSTRILSKKMYQEGSCFPENKDEMKRIGDGNPKNAGKRPVKGRSKRISYSPMNSGSFIYIKYNSTDFYIL